MAEGHIAESLCRPLRLRQCFKYAEARAAAAAHLHRKRARTFKPPLYFGYAAKLLFGRLCKPVRYRRRKRIRIASAYRRRGQLASSFIIWRR